jgi:hypothetical protein
MIEGSGSDELREQVPHKSRPTSAFPLGSRFETVANQPLNPQLDEKIGTIRRIRRRLARDFTPLVVGMTASILVSTAHLAAALSEGEALPLDGLLRTQDDNTSRNYAIAESAVIACGLFTGFLLILACYLVEHVKLLRRWRVAYGLVLVIWLSFWILAWRDRYSNTQPYRNRPPPSEASYIGFTALPIAAFVACIPLLIVGAITSLFMRRAKGPRSGSLPTDKEEDFSRGMATERRINDESFTNRPGPGVNPC